MTELEIARIESVLEFKVPESYREFILSYPGTLLRFKPGPAEREFFNSAELIIEANRQVRSANVIDWPEEFFAIGVSGCGDFYAMDMDDSESPIYF